MVLTFPPVNNVLIHRRHAISRPERAFAIYILICTTRNLLIHTCQALHGVVVGTSRDECRCQMSDQSNLATACDRAEEKIWVGYLLLNPSFILTYAEEGLFFGLATIALMWNPIRHSFDIGQSSVRVMIRNGEE